MTEEMSLDAAAEVVREAMREMVKRHSLWYFIQGGLMVLAGMLALIYSVICVSSGRSASRVAPDHQWSCSGDQPDRRPKVPHFWLQLISVVLSVVVGLMVLRDPKQGLAHNDRSADCVLHG